MPTPKSNAISDSVSAHPRKERRQYALSELLGLCDPTLPLTDEEQEWLDAPVVGLEELTSAAVRS